MTLYTIYLNDELTKTSAFGYCRSEWYWQNDSQRARTKQSEPRPANQGGGLRL